MSLKTVETFAIMPQENDFKNKEITINELREVYQKEWQARQARKHKLEEFIRQEQSCYERFKIRFRAFFAWILHRD